VGLLLLGDRTAPGMGWAAAAGFGCLVAATLLLSWNSGPAETGQPDPTQLGPQVNLLPARAGSVGSGATAMAIPTPREASYLTQERSAAGRHRRAG
jgi:hypothetical protein